MAATGYRYDGDVCRLVHESAASSPYLSDSADLVACPDDITLVGSGIGATRVARAGGYVLYSVPATE